MLLATLLHLVYGSCLLLKCNSVFFLLKMYKKLKITQ